MAAQLLHVLHGDGAACPSGDVVENAGDVDRVCHCSEVAVNTLGVALIVVRGDDQKAVRPQLLRPQALLQHGLGAVGAGAGDDGNASAHGLHHALEDGVVLLMGHGGAFAGGAQGEDGVGLAFQVPLDQLLELAEVYRAVVLEGRDQGYDGAFQIADTHW